MRFALLGDHADGLEMARALARTERHELAVYSGPSVGVEYLQRWSLTPRRVADLEEVLADPTIEAVIVAGSPATRPGQLRRALQSERHVLCVCPPDDSPDLAYEAAMIQADVRTLLFPILPETLHPALRRLAELARSQLAPWKERVTVSTLQAVSEHPHEPLPATPRVAPLSDLSDPITVRLIEVERWSTEEILLDAEEEGQRPGVPGWDILRAIGGEIGEIFALSGPGELDPGQPVLLSGQFVTGGLFQATYLPLQAEARLSVALVGRESRSELMFPEGWPGPARLTYTDDEGRAHVENWEAFDPWTALATAFESALASAAFAAPRGLSWQDAIRAAELDDAARRSAARRRASTLEYQEATEEAGFKGTMTLVGCSMLWIALILLILSAWVPWLGWVIAPVFGVFLLLQFLRWLMPGDEKQKDA